MPAPELNSHARRKLVAHVRATQPDCHLCGYPIRLDLDAQRHPLASCVDELVPRSHGGSPVDPGNVAHAHRLCNGLRCTEPITPALRRRCRAAVEQQIAPLVTRRAW